MARLETYVCDGCGAIKKEVNHWWNVRVGDHYQTKSPVMEIQTHRHPTSDITLCGIECVQKFASQWMAGLTGDIK